MRRSQLVPLVVATALFMENTDSTIIATALPVIARELNEDPTALKLALTSYLVSLAIFIPVSGWVADRYGSRTVFRAALAVFMGGSLACAAASSLGGFVAARFLQGLGGAMMVPVGRLVILRSVPKSELVGALAYLTVPALVGPVVGPPLGGLITTALNWRWIFLINIPIGLVGIALATRYFENLREAERARLDVVGFALSGAGLALLMLGLATGGRHLLAPAASYACLVAGAILVALYLVHARRTANPLIRLDLLRHPTFRAAILGGSVFRIGVGAVPFLLPLLFQLGFGLDALHSGLLTFASAAGALFMKTLAARILRARGFRAVLTVNAVLSSAFLGLSALFTATTPHALIIAALLVGGSLRSLQFTSVNAIAYAEIATRDMSAATSLAGVAQQLALSIGVALAAYVLETMGRLGGHAELTAGDFWPAFVAVALVSGLSALLFRGLHPDAGAEISGQRMIAAKPSAEPN